MAWNVLSVHWTKGEQERKRGAHRSPPGLGGHWGHRGQRGWRLAWLQVPARSPRKTDLPLGLGQAGGDKKEGRERDLSGQAGPGGGVRGEVLVTRLEETECLWEVTCFLSSRSLKNVV